MMYPQQLEQVSLASLAWREWLVTKCPEHFLSNKKVCKNKREIKTSLNEEYIKMETMWRYKEKKEENVCSYFNILEITII